MSGGMGYDGAYLLRTTLYILSVLLFVLEGGVYIIGLPAVAPFCVSLTYFCVRLTTFYRGYACYPFSWFPQT